MGVRTLTCAWAAGLLALAGCTTPGGDAKKPTGAARPDVTQPGVLPPPQETTRPVGAPAAPPAQGAGAGQVVQASATAGPNVPPPVPLPAATPPGPNPAAKIAAQFERKVVPTDIAIGWRPQIAYLPDPANNGRMSPGLAGQMFLYGGPKLEFAPANGVLTVDLVDESPRAPGAPAPLPERWQLPKSVLKNLQTRDETFGKSYVVFLPWPSYRPDITRVRIAARFDPEEGSTLYAPAQSVTLDNSKPFGAPVWDDKKERAEPLGAGGVNAFRPPTGATPGLGAPPAGLPLNAAPIPIGGPAAPAGRSAAPMMPIGGPVGPAPMMPIAREAAPLPIPNPGGAAPMIPIPNGPIPLRPEGANFPPPAPVAPPGVPDGLPPLTITLPGR